MSFTFEVIKKEPVDEEELSSTANSDSLNQFEFVNCRLLEAYRNITESNIETSLSRPIKTEPTPTEHGSLHTNIVLVKEDYDTNLPIHNTDNINCTKIMEDSGSHPVKTEAMSPKPDNEPSGSDEFDIDYNADIKTEFKEQKGEVCYPPNIKSTEIEERTLKQSQDVGIAVYSGTYGGGGDQSKDSPKGCLIGGYPDANTKDKSFYCNICTKSFIHKSRFTIHMRTHTGEKPYLCNFCDKSFTYTQSLLRHASTHTGDKPFSCGICKHSFVQKGHLLQHMRTHTGKKSSLCNICNKLLAHDGSLLRHMRTHTGEKTFSCDICKNSFLQKGQLLRHMRTHTGEKPYSCDVCKRSFSRDHNLVRHMRTHTGDKPYSCDICNNSFAHKEYFMDHKRAHTGEKPYSCKICKKSFPWSQNLSRHMRTHK